MRRMRINRDILNQVAKGFSENLVHLNLGANSLEKEGISVLSRQIQYGQGGDFVNPLNTKEVTKGVQEHRKMPWKLQSLVLQGNNISDFALDDIRMMVLNLKKLARLNLCDNMFYTERKFRDLINELLRDEDRQVIPIIEIANLQSQ